MKLSHKFVKSAPEELENGVLYISIEYRTVLHKCCCGCGSEVVTPLSPKDWKMTFDGESISLYPSIGNWKLKCQSHYWIKNSTVEWAAKWEDENIDSIIKSGGPKPKKSKGRKSLLRRIFGGDKT